MKKNSILSVISGFLTVSLLSLGFSSCSDNDASLNAPVPTASFTYNVLTPTSYAAPQNLELINTGSNGMLAYWNIPGIGNFQGDDVKVTIAFAGNYTVNLNVGGPGGLSDTIKQIVTIDKDNPYAIDPNGITGILTGAGLGLSQRTWIANPVLNSCVVAEDYASAMSQVNGTGGAWWGYGAGDIDPNTGRTGYLDDTYTFTFGQVGAFAYNDNNTVYLDAGRSGWTSALPAPWNTFGGNTSSTDLYNLVPALKPWGSGNFTYSIAAAPAGVNSLGQITVTGIGAHFGLQDKTNAGELTDPTGVSAITYDVLKIDADQTDASTGKHYDAIVIGLTYNTAGNVWTFWFRSDR